MGSFKGSLSSLAAGRAVARGLCRVWPEAPIEVISISDGGEGFTAALRSVYGARGVRTRARDPLGRRIRARWAYAAARRLAIVEVAAASGLGRLAAGELDPRRASTFGTGLLLRAALDRGARQLLLGLGGSATVDAGMGLLSALGVRWRDRRGRVLAPDGGALGRVAGVDLDALDPRLGRARLVVATDVDNPLLGPRGAVRVFGPQKGIRPAQRRSFEEGLGRFADACRRAAGRDCRTLRGAGAAGGIAFTLATLLDVEVVPGFGLCARATALAQRLAGADLVITGEGSFDRQSLGGKAPVAVARMARAKGVPVVVIAGRVELTPFQLRRLGVVDAVALVSGATPRAAAMRRARALLSESAAAVAGAWQAPPRR
jgi:glycerate kinase